MDPHHLWVAKILLAAGSTTCGITFVGVPTGVPLSCPFGILHPATPGLTTPALYTQKP